MVGEFAVGKGSTAAVLAEEFGPGFEDGWVGVDGLDGSCDAVLAQAGGVFCAGELDVLYSGAVVRVGVGGEDVDYHFDGCVADGVEGDLEAGGVGAFDDWFELGVGPEGDFEVGVVLVGLGEAGGAGVDDAVADYLDADDAAVGGGGGVELGGELDGAVDLGEGFGFGWEGLDEPVAGEADGDGAVGCDEGLDGFPGAFVHGHVDHAGVACFVVGCDGGADGGCTLFHGGYAGEIGPNVSDVGCFGEDAGELAVGVPFYDAAWDVGPVFCAKFFDAGCVAPG